MAVSNFMNAVSKDVQQTLILFLSERGHGKSTSLKSIIQHILKTQPETVIKVFDTSTSWYRVAPLPWRQRVTLDKLTKGKIVNLDNSVYELGDLPLEYRRMFVASIIQSDFTKARENTIEDDSTPKTIYVIEESNTIFNSYSFRKNDEYSTVLSDFVSVGRNFGMSAFLVATAATGELSPSLRRRSRRIYGRVTAPGDLQQARRRSPQLAEQIKNQPRFVFSYEGDTIYTAKLPDTCKNTPTEHIPEPQATTTQTESNFNDQWWITFGSTLMIFILFWGWLMNL